MINTSPWVKNNIQMFPWNEDSFDRFKMANNLQSDICIFLKSANWFYKTHHQWFRGHFLGLDFETLIQGSSFIANNHMLVHLLTFRVKSLKLWLLQWETNYTCSRIKNKTLAMLSTDCPKSSWRLLFPPIQTMNSYIFPGEAVQNWIFSGISIYNRKVLFDTKNDHFAQQSQIKFFSGSNFFF